MVTKAIEDKVAVGHSEHETEVNNVMNKFNKQHEALRDELRSLIKDVEAKCAPKTYALNVDTMQAHRILTSFNEVGSLAKCHRSWKYALPRAKLRLLKPDEIGGFKACGTCFDLASSA